MINKRGMWFLTLFSLFLAIVLMKKY